MGEAEDAEAIQRQADQDMAEAAEAMKRERERREAQDIEQKANEDMEEGIQAQRSSEAKSREIREARKQQFDAERKMERVRRDAEDKTEAGKERKRQFEKEQEKWNLEQKLKAKDEEYQEEQKRIQKERELKPITPKSVSEKAGKVGKKLVDDVLGKKKKPEDSGNPELEILREKNRHAENMQKLRNQKPTGKGVSQKPTRGQFKAPGKGTGYIDPFPKSGGRGGGGFPNVDPFGGMRGGGHALDISFGLPGGGKKAAPPRPAPVHKPAPAPARNPMRMFRDPFKGLPKATQPGKMPTAKGNSLIVPAKSTSKKKKPGWMDF